MGDKHSHAGATIGCQCASSIESEPSHPEHAGTGEAHGQIVRHHGCCWKPLTLSDDYCKYQGADTRGYVHYRAASEVDQPHLA